MDSQQVAAVLFFWGIALVMGYSFFHIEKALELYKRFYKFLGISLDFSDRGRILARGVTGLLCLVFLLGSIFVILD